MNFKKNTLTAIVLSIPLIGCGSSSDNNSPSNALQECTIEAAELKGTNTSAYWCAYVNSRDSVTKLLTNDHGFQEEDIIADFSYAGFGKGEESLPDTSILSNYHVYNVTDYGAVANDANSDKSALKAVIAQIKLDRQNSETLKPAMIYFPEGQFIVNDSHDMSGINSSMSSEELAELQPIFIDIDNVIVKGEGEKTTLFMKEKLLPTNPTQMWSIPYLIQIGAPSQSLDVSTQVISTAPAFSTRSIEVENADQFEVGDSISLTSMATSLSEIEQAISPYKLEKTQEGNSLWSSLASGLKRISKHTVTAIEGNQVELSTPVPHGIKAGQVWTMSKIPSFENIGFEDLTLRGNWQSTFEHHGSADHDGAFSLLAMKRVHNSWVKNVSFIDTNRALEVVNAYNLTNENITISGTPGHSAISISTSNNILSKNIKDYSNAWHASGLSKYTTTSVYLNSDYSAEMNIDLHGEQSVNNLFDNVKGGWNYGHWGASSKNQPNHLKGLIFWNGVNTSVASEDGPDFDNYMFMNDQSDFGRLIMPYVIGLQGKQITFAAQSQYMHQMVSEGKAEYGSHQTCDIVSGEKVCTGPLQAYLESNGAHVYPTSLYQAQLDYRLNH